MFSEEAGKIHNYIIIVGVLVSSHVVSVRSCNMEDIMTCRHLDELKRNMWEFLPESDIDHKCRTTEMALTCALKPEFIDGCDESKIVKYRSDKAFYDTICKTHKFAYLQGVGCFALPEINSGIHKCVSMLKRKRRRNPCGFDVFTEARQCYRDPLKGATVPGCSQEDFNLLGLFADLTIRPHSDSVGCDWTDIATGPLAMPTTTEAETTTASTTTMAPTTSVDMRTETTDVGQITETENVGKVRGSNGGSARTTATVGAALLSLFLLALLV